MTAAGADGAIPSDGGPLAYVADLDAPVLDPSDHHHLARVRRVREGDELIVGDGCGRWRRARMAVAPEPAGEIVVAAHRVPPVAVGFALVKGAKPELVVQKLTELGVDRIVPFTAARSIVRWDRTKAEANHVRLQKVAREAAMQSRQPWIPEVAPVATFDAVAAEPGAVLADRDGAAPDLQHPFVLVGPEGGWAPEELGAGLPRMALAGGVLRAETAAIVAGIVLIALREGLVAPSRGAST